MAEKKVDAFELDGIRALVEIMKENDVSEVELEQDGKRLKLSRGVGVVYEREASVAPERRVEAPSAPSESRDDEARAQKNDSANYKTINSPMVGTYYAASGPDKPPFVKVGDRVTPEKTVCIIEAMKVFNEVQAECSGLVVEILVSDGQAVEFGTPLLKVDARG